MALTGSVLELCSQLSPGKEPFSFTTFFFWCLSGPLGQYKKNLCPLDMAMGGDQVNKRHKEELVG